MLHLINLAQVFIQLQLAAFAQRLPFTRLHAAALPLQQQPALQRASQLQAGHHGDGGHVAEQHQEAQRLQQGGGNAPAGGSLTCARNSMSITAWPFSYDNLNFEESVPDWLTILTMKSRISIEISKLTK